MGASRLPTTSRILVLVGVVLALTGSCTGSVNSGDAVSERSSTSTSDRVAMPEPVGPLAGLEWPSGSVPKEMLLHDDGGRLWAVPLDGEPTLIWTHPAAHVYDIAAAPSGHQLAYSVRLPAKNARDPSWVLYLLDADGRVRTVDVVRGFRYIASPVFLTPPTELDGPVRLYWIRGSEEVSPETGRLMTEVMVLGDKAPTHVDVPLRYEEAPWEIHGYAGSWMFTVTLFRTNDVPTRLEVLQNVDFGQAATDASLTLWGDLEKPVNTDAFTGVAWLTPTEYVSSIPSGSVSGSSASAVSSTGPTSSTAEGVSTPDTQTHRGPCCQPALIMCLCCVGGTYNESRRDARTRPPGSWSTSRPARSA